MKELKTRSLGCGASDLRPLTAAPTLFGLREFLLQHCRGFLRSWVEGTR